MWGYDPKTEKHRVIYNKNKGLSGVSNNIYHYILIQNYSVTPRLLQPWTETLNPDISTTGSERKKEHFCKCQRLHKEFIWNSVFHFYLLPAGREVYQPEIERR